MTRATTAPASPQRRGKQHALDRPTRIVLLIIAISLVMRVILAASIGLGVDESYAVSIARQPSLSYFDHPPLSFWIVGGLARIARSEQRVIVRLPFILLFAGTTWLLFRLGARLFGEWAGACAALLLNITPVFSLSTGGWVLPDGPLMFFMLASTLCLTRVLIDERPPPHPTRWWTAAGVMQGARGAAHDDVHVMALLQNLGGQAGYLLPWIWVPIVWLLVAVLVHGPRAKARWFLCCLAIGPIATFTLLSLDGNPGLPHWEAPGYLMLFPLLGAAVATRIEHRSVATRRWLIGSTAAFVILVALVTSDTATGWIARAAPSLFRRGDPTLEALDWTDLRRAVERRHLLDRPAMFVAAPNWIQAGKASYALGPGVPVLCLDRNPHHFRYLHDQAAFVGHDALIITRVDRGADAPTAYAPYFASVEPLGRVPIRRAGYAEFDVALYLAHALVRPYPVEPPP